MKVLVTGAAGMLGRKFCQRLATNCVIARKKVQSLTMVDIVDSTPIAASPFTIQVGAQSTRSVPTGRPLELPA
jgi:nucleoside-diphosphate-sugar epimerase